MVNATDRLLIVDSIVTGYGKKQVLYGVTLEISPGEIVALLGHNGAGKSTLLKAVFGKLPIWSGSVILDSAKLKDANPLKLLHMGVAYVPQGNRVFSDLTVAENLEIGGTTLPKGTSLGERIDGVLALFPVLGSRLRQRAGTLSGGEKQMLALANALILSPRLLLLDEPSLGLSPSLVKGALERIQAISCDSGTAVLIVEQKVRDVLRIAQRAYVVRNGEISFSGPSELLNNEKMLRDVYL